MIRTLQLTRPVAYVRIILGTLLFYLLTSLSILWVRINPVLDSDLLPTGKKVSILISSLFSFADLYTPLTGTITIVNAVLFGLVVHLLWIHFRTNKKAFVQGSGKSALASVLGIIGAGCAACGTLVLGPLFASVGAAGLIAALPGHGVEFGILGTALLGYSVWDLYRKTRTPQVCAI